MKATNSERPIVRALRKAIKADPRTINALAVEAGIPVPVLWRFVQRERGMNLDSRLVIWNLTLPVGNIQGERYEGHRLHTCVNRRTSGNRGKLGGPG